MSKSTPPPVVALIEAFGGLSEMSRKLDHRGITTIQSWRNAGHIPRWRRTEIEDAARVFKVKLPDAFERCFKLKAAA